VKRGNEPARAVRVEAHVQPEALIEDLTNIDNIYKLIREEQGDRDEAKYRVDEDGIAYLYLPHFGYSPEKIGKLVEKIQKARALVVDLRDNPGGREETLSAFLGHFQTEPAVIGETISRKKKEPMKVKPQKLQLSIPLFFLVDSESSSAAEVVPRHLQLAGRAVVVGDRTAGRVTGARFYIGHTGTQTVTFYGISVAVERLVFPDGQELEGRGVTPDQVCLPAPEDLREGRDPCLARAMTLAQEKLK
jgi:carboxyl-terminal processing protease